MKNTGKKVPLLLLSILLILTYNCKKDPPKTQPVVNTSQVTDVTTSSANAHAEVTFDGGVPILERGICWSLSNSSPTTADTKISLGTGTGIFGTSLSGLNPGTTYYLRAFATNSIGTAYGNTLSFSTLATVPVLTTATVSSISPSSAVSGGTITSDGGSAVTARGVCWSTTSNPTISIQCTLDGSGTGTFTSAITGLASKSNYYVRAYATNSIGTSYGNELNFTTSGDLAETVKDIDGNVYHTVTIGSQVWMVENLKVTKYRNGDPIPVITDYTQWDALTSGARVTNTFIQGYSDTYGWFYNWYAVNDNRTICPSGWHIPTDAEITTISTYLGGDAVSGGKLKESGLSHWESPNTGATNESGFTALPGAFYLANAGYVSPGNFGMWWTSSEYNSTDSWNWNLDNTSTTLNKVFNKNPVDLVSDASKIKSYYSFIIKKGLADY